MVGQEGPGIDQPGAPLGQGRQAPDEVRSIPVIPEDDLAIQAPATMLAWFSLSEMRYSSFWTTVGMTP